MLSQADKQTTSGGKTLSPPTYLEVINDDRTIRNSKKRIELIELRFHVRLDTVYVISGIFGDVLSR